MLTASKFEQKFPIAVKVYYYGAELDSREFPRFQMLTTVRLNNQLFRESTRLYSQSGTSKNHGPGTTWTMDNQDGMRISYVNGIRNGQRLITWTFCTLTKKLFASQRVLPSNPMTHGHCPQGNGVSSLLGSDVLPVLSTALTTNNLP